jgi:hypothetical protein
MYEALGSECLQGKHVYVWRCARCLSLPAPAVTVYVAATDILRPLAGTWSDFCAPPSAASTVSGKFVVGVRAVCQGTACGVLVALCSRQW